MKSLAFTVDSYTPAQAILTKRIPENVKRAELVAYFEKEERLTRGQALEEANRLLSRTEDAFPQPHLPHKFEPTGSYLGHPAQPDRCVHCGQSKEKGPHEGTHDSTHDIMASEIREKLGLSLESWEKLSPQEKQAKAREALGKTQDTKTSKELVQAAMKEGRKTPSELSQATGLPSYVVREVLREMFPGSLDGKTTDMRFYTTEKIGPNRFLTPEGFLYCQNTPIARTGIQIYGPDETPLKPGPDGLVHIDRRPEDVFKSVVIDSANGKPLINEHPDPELYPDGEVNPANWKELAAGIMIQARRGSPPDEMLLVADLLICDQAIIGLLYDRETGLAVDDKVELSLGYDCEYVEDAPGIGHQEDIVVNHVALVDSGRCGARCAVRDSALPSTKTCRCQEAGPMTFDAAKRNLRKALDSKDAKEIDAAMKELDKAKDEEVEEAEKKAKEEAKDKKKSKDADGEEEWTPEKISARFEAHDAKFKAHDSAMEGLEGRIKACEEATTHDEESKEEEKKTEDAMEEEAPEGTGDKARKSKDSAYLEESVQATISGCEIIAPGLHYPTFDSATPRRKTLDTICALRRRALGVFASTMDGAGTVAALRGGKVLTQDGLTKMTCDDVRTIFRGAVAAKGRSNSEPERISATRTHDAKPTLTLADLNKRNRALFPDNK